MLGMRAIDVMPFRTRVLVGFLAATGLSVSAFASGQSLSRDAAEHFLMTADVVDAERAGKGTTLPWRLTLSDGTTTHDALFQSVNDRRAIGRLSNGQVVLNFADSFEFNIAAYRLAKLVGLGHMIPVTVRRQWRGQEGALSWWVDDVLLDERERVDREIEPPNPAMWQAQWCNLRVFAQLVSDSDRNQGNILYTDHWRLWMIDFTRAFTISTDIRTVDHLVRVDRSLFQRLKALDAVEVREELAPNLTSRETEALLKRCALIIQYVESQIAEHGEDSILF